MSRSRTVRVAALVATLALVASACADPGADSGLRGTVAADGSSTVFPLTEAVGEEFRRDHPRVDVVVGTSGTGGGFKKFCNGEIDVADASRKIKESEIAACKAKGIGYIELTVAIDGLAVVVNPKNTWIDCITVDELKRLWEPKSKARAWNALRDGFPSQRIKLFGPGTDSGTFDYFTKEVVGEEGASRSDYTASEDDNTLVLGVAGERFALGYFGFAFYEENRDKLKVLGVDDGDGCVVPSDETVRSNEYAPLSRPLFIYVKKATLTREEIREFVRFYLEGAQVLAKDVGYTAVSDEVLRAETAEFEQAVATA